MWLRGQPQENYNCAIIQCNNLHSCGWKAADCSQKYPVICVLPGRRVSIENLKSRCSFSLKFYGRF